MINSTDQPAMVPVTDYAMVDGAVQTLLLSERDPVSEIHHTGKHEMDAELEDGEPSDDWYIVRAIELHNDDGVVEVGEGIEGAEPVVSRSDEGAYVQAWVWVDNPNYDPEEQS